VEGQERRVRSGAAAVMGRHGLDPARMDVRDPGHAMPRSHDTMRVPDHAHDVADVPHQPALALGHVHPTRGPTHPGHCLAMALGHVRPVNDPVNPRDQPALALGHVRPVNSHHRPALALDHAPRVNPVYAAVASRTRRHHAGPLDRAARTPGHHVRMGRQHDAQPVR
jgi:hypothetical protein